MSSTTSPCINANSDIVHAAEHNTAVKVNSLPASSMIVPPVPLLCSACEAKLAGCHACSALRAEAKAKFLNHLNSFLESQEFAECVERGKRQDAVIEELEKTIELVRGDMQEMQSRFGTLTGKGSRVASDRHEAGLLLQDIGKDLSQMRDSLNNVGSSSSSANSSSKDKKRKSDNNTDIVDNTRSTRSRV